MLDKKILSNLYDELEGKYPLRTGGKEKKTHNGLRQEEQTADLSLRWQQEAFDLKEQLLTQVLFQLHTLFEMPADDSEVQRLARDALDKIFSMEEACRADGPYDAHSYASFLFRKQWHAAAGGATAPDRLRAPGPQASTFPAGGSPTLLSGLYHIGQASFFQKHRQEIAGWTKRFLLVERYHRLDAIEHENRLDRYRLLRSELRTPGESAWNLEDILIWLEFRLLEQPDPHDPDIGALSRELTHELEGPVSNELFEGAPVQPSLYILLKCHHYCLAETLDTNERRRIEELFATRQLDNILDLMRVVLTRTIGEHSIPETGTLLDRLQAEGFNIEHQGFRDPYEAHLVSLEDVERLETTRLPMFLPLGRLSGDFRQDLLLSKEIMVEWHNRIAKDVVGDCEAYVLAVTQPLPKAHLVTKMVRFAVSWILAGFSWLPGRQPEKLAEEVRTVLPESSVRQLVRPRKGYDLKSRNDLNRLIDRELRQQWEALERIAHSRQIQGFHDYTQFVRYVTFQALRERSGGDLRNKFQESIARIPDMVQPQRIAAVCRKWGLDIKQAQPHSLQSVEQYARNTVPSQLVVEQLVRHFETSGGDLEEVYSSVIDEFTPAFYKALVAYERHRADLPRLQATPDEVAQISNLLAPPLEAIQKMAFLSVQQDFSESTVPLYRELLRPYLLSSAEWKAYLAWQIHRRIGDDVSRFLDDGDLDGLLLELEHAAGKVELPANTLSHETLKSTLLDLLKPQDAAPEASESVVREILQLLPQLDCAACGHTSCRQFAHALLAGRAEPRHCVQLPTHAVPSLMNRLQKHEERGKNGSRSTNMLELLSNHRQWRSSPDRRVFQNVLSAKAQKARRLIMERLRGIWENLPAKPQIFKHPSLEKVYEELCKHMGREAVERLREDERSFLAEYGEEKLKAEYRMLKERQNWLNLANRNRQSRPLLLRQDPAWVAAEIYQRVFFLHQLSPEDRYLVLRYRFDKHHDGFSYWWNEDLLTMNLPDFFIRDWEDFSKIIKNAYWHQESSLSAGQVLSTLKAEVLFAENTARILDALINHLVDVEIFLLEQKRNKLEQFRRAGRENPIAVIEDLRELIQALVSKAQPSGVDAVGPKAGSSLVSMEDWVLLDAEKLWNEFQEEKFSFDINFSCHMDQLSTTEKKALQDQPSTDGADPLSAPQSSPWYLTNWDEPLYKRVALIRALITAAVRERHLEEQERLWFEKMIEASGNDEDKTFDAPSSCLRLLIRRELRNGKERKVIEAELQKLLASHSNLQNQLLDDAICRLILTRHCESLRRPAKGSFLAQSSRLGLVDAASTDSRAFPADRPREEDALLQAFPELKSFVDLVLERSKTMDRDRLLHYLFLLAKMEGNLDSLTALLREIRETSDIMEAAWLRFTEERILEGPGSKSLPGTTLGIPLLASRVKDKEAINRGLSEGVSRKEKRNISAAVHELINFIRFHVLLNMENNGSLQKLLNDFLTSGYDLSGIDESVLENAIQRQWERREQFVDEKIWIYTTVTARRLAAQDQELQEAEREFYAIRSDILKDGAPADDRYHEIASRRGVALGRIKEEMYRQLSDLLKKERISTFQQRIHQIVDQLDEKREEIYRGWLNGAINRRTIFYLLRQHQKSERDPNWDDFQCFLRDHWFNPLAELRASLRPDRQERIRELDHRLQALLRISLLELEAEAERMAE
ncbi:MAG: (Fe-S)-binding protein, partial [Desulforhabdus sp.]|nr:(Fe-S)-binding protein [Desulforhabdus sp.]